MYCIKCGAKNDDDSIFCFKCGADIGEKPQSKKGPGVIKKLDSGVIKKLDSGVIKKLDLGVIKKLDLGVIKKLHKIKLRSRDIWKTIDVVLILLILLSTITVFNQYMIDKNRDSSNDIVNVSIDSIPTEANVYIDSIYSGQTPVTVVLPSGNYGLKMNITGYKSIKTDFNVTSDASRLDVQAYFVPSNGAKYGNVTYGR